MGGRHRARGHRAGGFKRMRGRRRVGSHPAPASGHAGRGRRQGPWRRDRAAATLPSWYCDGGREYCGSSRCSTVGVGTEPVASDCEANGSEKGSCESRDDMSALQPANPIDISASTATCGARREQSNSTTPDMVTHSYATNYDLSKHPRSKQPLNPANRMRGDRRSTGLQLPRDARQRRHETHVHQLLALQSVLGTDHPDEGL